MDETDFEGTLVLENLAESDMIDEFFDALDSDDTARAKELMESAGIDEKTISIVLQKMYDADDP